MGILYAMVARASWVLAEFNAAPSRNGAVVKRKILYGDGPKNNTMASYTQGRFFFHLKRTDDLTVLCMVDENSGRKISIFFLTTKRHVVSHALCARNFIIVFTFFDIYMKIIFCSESNLCVMDNRKNLNSIFKNDVFNLMKLYYELQTYDYYPYFSSDVLLRLSLFLICIVSWYFS